MIYLYNKKIALPNLFKNISFITLNDCRFNINKNKSSNAKTRSDLDHQAHGITCLKNHSEEEENWLGKESHADKQSYGNSCVAQNI